jgi:hypothetical protein
VLFILLCSPIFFDHRPHDFAMMCFGFSCYVTAVAFLERRMAPNLILKNLMTAALVASAVLTVAALVYLVMHVSVAPQPLEAAAALLSRNVLLFLIVSRGAYFAWQQKNLRPFVALYALLILLSPILIDFGLIACGPLLTLGIWAVGLDLRSLRRRLTL